MANIQDDAVAQMRDSGYTEDEIQTYLDSFNEGVGVPIQHLDGYDQKLHPTSTEIKVESNNLQMSVLDGGTGHITGNTELHAGVNPFTEAAEKGSLPAKEITPGRRS